MTGLLAVAQTVGLGVFGGVLGSGIVLGIYWLGWRNGSRHEQSMTQFRDMVKSAEKCNAQIRADLKEARESKARTDDAKFLSLLL